MKKYKVLVKREFWFNPLLDKPDATIGDEVAVWKSNNNLVMLKLENGCKFEVSK